MKLQIGFPANYLPVEFKSEPGRATLRIASTEYTAEIIEAQPDIYTVILDGKVYRCFIEKAADGRCEIIVNGARIPVSIQDPKRLIHSSAAGGAGGGRAVLAAPMPGKVVRILAAQGDAVTEGQGILVVEAMKMQNEVQAPKNGTLTQLNVSEGQTVNAGETMAVIE